MTETRILNRVIAAILQEDLLSMNLSTLIPEALKTSEYMETLLEESIRAFQAAEVSKQVASGQAHLAAGRKIRAKAG